jgi:CRISP-associated protein Cas1
MQLVLDTAGLSLTKKRQSFLITLENGESKTFSPNKITSIAITANVNLSADAVRLAVKNQIPILFFDKIGKAEARLWSPYFESIATLRRQQVRFSESPQATQWIIDVFHLKTQHQIQNLQYLHNRKEAQRVDLARAIQQMETYVKQFEKYNNLKISEVRNNLMGIEGNLAKVYFQAISPCLPLLYQYEKRSRQPAEDMFNASLNYFYGMLYTIVEGALFAAGLDPHLGILHADEYHKPVLAFDLIEVFRPWLDSMLIDLCLREELLKSYFSANQHGVFFNKSGKAVLIPHFNAWLRETKRFQERDTTIRQHIYNTAGLLSSRIRNFETGTE